MHGDPKFYDLNICVCVIYDIYISGVSLSKAIFPYKYRQILKLLSYQGNVKGKCISKTSMGTPYFYAIFLFLSIRWYWLQEIRKINSKFNYTHTSLNKKICCWFVLITVKIKQWWITSVHLEYLQTWVKCQNTNYTILFTFTLQN